MENETRLRRSSSADAVGAATNQIFFQAPGRNAKKKAGIPVISTGVQKCGDMTEANSRDRLLALKSSGPEPCYQPSLSG